MRYYIAVAMYDTTVNAVREGRVLSSNDYNIVWKLFCTMADAGAAVYLWVYSKECPVLIATTQAMQNEYNKIKD